MFHVFPLLGQSNMAVYPKASNADKTENPRIKVLGFDDCAWTGRVEGPWDIAAPPLHECWNGAIGPGDCFAKTIIDRYPAQNSAGLVPSAISRERVETSMKAGGAKYS
ncbi:sialate O-acetylesterase [Sorangium sp. So ce260]|uniref:sialate O-acetylesterase n=1 Tax=Sorangium sp. So ce260 TaxID=3133291 RepID=UPI003F634A4B